MLTACKKRLVDRNGECVYITWPYLAWLHSTQGQKPWYFGEYPPPLKPDNSWNFLFEVHEENLVEEPLVMSSPKGPHTVRLKCASRSGAMALVQVLRNLGARGLAEVSIEPECTPTDPECTECWGTGSYRGWGADCSRGCKK